MIVVIDGPAGSGKSSTARAVAGKLQIQFLDSGALYRVATLVYLDTEKDYHAFFEKFNKSKISFHFKNERFHVYLNDEDVTDAIREMEVSEHVSEVASNPKIRREVNDLMREVVKHDIYIADGRDLGTAVFPDAELKFFMNADLDTRAQRRYRELKQEGQDVSLEEIKENLAQRDEMDSNRAADPLKKAEDAIEIDTSACSFEEQVSIICEKISKRIN
ncbi:MAG: (d)CMP kinase [Balneolaceae bacterium]|nr:(d)CMP kinase [Balneolaceae bacterium]